MKSNNQSDIRKLVIQKYLLVAFGSTVSYIFFFWLFYVKFHLLNRGTSDLTFLLLLAWTFVPSWIWIRPLNKVLRIKEKDIILSYYNSITHLRKARRSSEKVVKISFWISSMISIVFLLTIAQATLMETTKQLTAVATVNEIEASEISPYFTIQDLTILPDSGYVYVEFTSNLGSKPSHKTYSVGNTYFYPIKDSGFDSENSIRKYWLTFSDSFRLEKEYTLEEKEEYRRLKNHAVNSGSYGRQFAQQLISAQYFKRKSYSNDLISKLTRLLSGGRTRMRTNTGIIFFSPAYEPFPERFYMGALFLVLNLGLMIVYLLFATQKVWIVEE